MFEKTKLLSSILALTMIFICFELFISGYAPYVVVMGAIFAVVFVGMNAISIYIKKSVSSVLFYFVLTMLVILVLITLPYEPIYSLILYMAASIVYFILSFKPYRNWANNYGLEVTMWLLGALVVFSFGSSASIGLSTRDAFVYTLAAGFGICGESCLFVKALN